MKKKAAEGKVSQADVDWFIETLTSPEANIADIKHYIDEIQKLCVKPNQAILLAQTRIQLHKAHFGEKSTNVNYNVNIGIEEWERRIYGDEKNAEVEVEVEVEQRVPEP
jgi:hypothetical protein